MNIIEAIKSGKRFRHSLTGTSWFNPIKDPDTSLVHLKLDVNQLVSNDWEVEEEKATITAAQFQKALDAASLSRQWIIPAPFVQDPAILHAYHRDVVAMFDDFVVKLKKELGL